MHARQALGVGDRVCSRGRSAPPKFAPTTSVNRWTRAWAAAWIGSNASSASASSIEFITA